MTASSASVTRSRGTGRTPAETAHCLARKRAGSTGNCGIMRQRTASHGNAREAQETTGSFASALPRTETRGRNRKRRDHAPAHCLARKRAGRTGNRWILLPRTASNARICPSQWFRAVSVPFPCCFRAFPRKAVPTSGRARLRAPVPATGHARSRQSRGGPSGLGAQPARCVVYATCVMRHSPRDRTSVNVSTPQCENTPSRWKSYAAWTSASDP